MGTKTSHLLSFVSGAITGGLIGILYAPDKGTNTRNKLTFKLDKYRLRLKEIIDQLSADRDQPLSAARVEGEKVINDARSKAEKLLEDVEDLIDQIKRKDREAQL